MPIEEFAAAKVNLALHVTGRRADGYHLLDSLVAFVDVGDKLTAASAPATTLTLAGPFGAGVPAGADNLVLRAARMVAGGMGVAFTLDKRLPPASGIGGGSADAAAAIRAVLRLLHGPEAAAAFRARRQALDRAALAALGADVPVCLMSEAARMRGIGEDLAPAGPLPETCILLVNPGIELPTPAVFQALPEKSHPPLPAELPGWPDARALAQWLAAQRNDLESPARRIAPSIAEVLEALEGQPGTLLARMSGSGATCFALFAHAAQARAAGAAIRGARPAWWVAEGRLLRDPAAGRGGLS